MTMDREGVDEGEERGAFLDEGNANLPEEVDVVQGIFSVIERVARFGDYRRTQKKECYNLVRRMKLLLPLLEEIREIDKPISVNAHNWLCVLQKALVLAKKLLQLCNEGSKIYLAIESEAIMIKFHNVYENLSQAFKSLPTEELELSDEVKEQLELMAVQLGRAKRRTDTQDIELAVDVMFLLSNKDDQNAERAMVERLAKKLVLQTVEDLKIETIAVQSLSKGRGGPSAETTKKILELLNKFKRVAGMEETKALDDPVQNKMLIRSASLVIPHEFLCPITLEIMTDPVIIASGQTYERESIQKWFDTNHRTCPKTRQILAHLSIAPNYALKNIIMQWCETNNVHLRKKIRCSSVQGSPGNEQKEDLSSLVQELSSVHLEVQRNAVTQIRLLSKENSESRIMIAESGGISPLIQLLSYPDPKIQEHAVTALLNLSIDECNKKLISSGGAIPAIIEVLKQGSVEARENSAAALFSLSMLDENKVLIAQSNGIPPLIGLLKEGTIRGKKDALTALFNLTLDYANKAKAVSAGIVTPLLKLLKDQNLGMIDEALSVFLLLATHPDGRQAIGQLSFIETLVEFIREGTPKNQECAASVLLELGSKNSSCVLAALQYGVYEHLVQLKSNGTNRGQRKANAMLNLISRSEHL